MRTVVLNLTQKISAISCPSRQTLPPERSLRSAHRLSAQAAQQNRRLRTDRVVRPYRMLRIRKKPLARHHQDSVRRGVRRSQLHCASAGAAKAPYSLAPSSFPNCDRCAGSQFGDTRALPVSGLLFPFLHRARRSLFFLKEEKEKNGGAKTLHNLSTKECGMLKPELLKSV